MIMSDRIPSISAIIPTHGRLDLLRKTIESLSNSASFFMGFYETIIVDSSIETDAEQIQLLCQINNAMYIQGPASVREKRNLGAGLACGDILLFIDSDCISSEELLLEHTRTYQENPEAKGVCGVTEFIGHKGVHWWIIEQSGLLDAFSFASRYDRVQWCTTSNFSVKKDVFWSHKGFDEKFPFKLGGDDLDLTYRITQKGGLILSNSKAIVFHTTETWSSMKAVGERAFRWGRMGYHVFSKHKDLQYIDLPKPLLILFTVLVLYYIKVGIHDGMKESWVIALFLGVFSVINFILFQSGKVGWKRLIAQFSTFYKLIYKIGLMIEFLMHGSLKFLYSRTVFSYYQLVDEWPSNVSTQWAMILSFILGWAVWVIIR